MSKWLIDIHYNFWAKIQYGSQNPIKFAKISKHRLILVHNKLGNPGSYCAKNHVIPPKPLRSEAKKPSKGWEGKLTRRGFNEKRAINMPKFKSTD